MNTTGNSFDSLALAEPIQRALREKNYTHPSPIQEQAVPHLLEGRDLIGCAQTGTGKTAAFALPILHLLAEKNRPAAPKRPRALILTPTRELASQIADNFAAYGRHLRLSHHVIFGGVGQNPQVKALARGTDILIATPGRLLDLLQQGHLALDRVEIFVLDEADRMLDMGFVHDVKKVMAKLPPRRQSLLFSATMPPAIRQLAGSLLHNPARVEVTPVSSTAERIRQHVCHVERGRKRDLLVHLLQIHPDGLALIFVRMKHGANRLAEQLGSSGIPAEAIHGNKSQGARERALENFRSGRTRVLVATDIAARGIDVKGISLVINYDIPNEPESYVHRIGRTARAGAEGLAFSLCEPSERASLHGIERLIRKTIPVFNDHPFAGSPTPETVPSGNASSAAHRPAGRGRGFQSHHPSTRPPGRSRRNRGRGKKNAAQHRHSSPQGRRARNTQASA